MPKIKKQEVVDEFEQWALANAKRARLECSGCADPEDLKEAREECAALWGFANLLCNDYLDGRGIAGFDARRVKRDQLIMAGTRAAGIQ